MQHPGKRGAAIRSQKLEEEGKPSHRWVAVGLLGVFIFLELSYFERKYKKRLQFNPHSAKIKQSQEKREKKRKTHRRFGHIFHVFHDDIEPIKSSPDVFLPK